MITILAFITMLVDHIGYIFFPTEEIWRIIGRIAFPLFAWGIVRGAKLTKDRQKYAKRIFILAIISQIPAFFLFGFEFYNVLFTLLFGLLSIFIIENKKINNYFQILIIAILLIIAQYLNFDYGAYGILTIILIYFFWQQKKSILFFTLLTFLFWCIDFKNFSLHFSIELYSIISFLILYFTQIQKYDFKINFYIKYGFYPFHLALLYGIYLIMK
ncbi:MAG: TraX family protein [Candidatus Gracilibacteria bacterium]|nr:TraX family protein [Candidatus Gracilibacteria bacterium]